MFGEIIGIGAGLRASNIPINYLKKGNVLLCLSDSHGRPGWFKKGKIYHIKRDSVGEWGTNSESHTHGTCLGYYGQTFVLPTTLHKLLYGVEND